MLKFLSLMQKYLSHGFKCTVHESRRLENKCTTQNTTESVAGLNSDPFLPDEIIIEILSWLSVEALGRVKCVCKSWCATIQEHNFVQKQMSRSKIIQGFDANEEAYMYLYVQDGLMLECSRTFKEYRIRNPSTKQIFDLPNPLEEVMLISMFFLSTGNDNKVVYIHREGGATSNAVGARVLTIGTDSTWRSLDIPGLHNLKSQRGQMLQMSTAEVYYVIGLGDYKIICLEMDTESSISVNIPEDLFPEWKNIHPLNWEEKLALASVVGEKVTVWVLENYKKQKWAAREVVITLNSTVKCPSSVPNNLIPFMIHGDWLWISDNSERLIAYNMRTNSVSKLYAAPLGQKIMCVYQPSVEHLKGMTHLED